MCPFSEQLEDFFVVHYPVPRSLLRPHWFALSREAWAYVALSAFVLAIWAWHHGAWSRESWTTPTDYRGDSHEILARLKAASEGDTWPLRQQVISRLGAPWGAHWSEYPTTDKLLVIALGGIVRFAGLGVAANFALVMAAMTAAWAFFFASRRLGAAWEWAFVGALLFAFSCSVFQRGLAHLLLLYTWTVPAGLLACAYVARSQRLSWTASEAWVCGFAAVGLGLSNPYHLFFWGQLLVWAVILRVVRDGRATSIKVGFATGALSLAAFFVAHGESWLFAQDGALPLLVRNYGGTEAYALKPIELFIPPQEHRWSWLSFFGDRYARWSEWRGESYLPYLGLVGIFAWVWLSIETIVRLLRGRAVSGWALQSAWIFVYASLGGLSNFLALFASFHLFRATNRASIFLTCGMLLFLMFRLSVALRGRPRASLLLAVFVAIVGVLDQVPRGSASEDRETVRLRVAADAGFGKELEAALGPGAMVFQLPVLGFPEILPPHRMADYEHFRPYLHTERVRFSYGAPKTRSRLRWQRELEDVATPEMVRRLELAGFSAIYINRRGFGDGAAQLVSELDALGYRTVIEGSMKEQVAVLLRPSSRPRPPLARSFTYGVGWYPQPTSETDESIRWSHGAARLSYFNPHRHPVVATVKFRLSAMAQREIGLALNRAPVLSAVISQRPSEIGPLDVTLQPGVNNFEFVTRDPPVKVSASTARLRAIGLHEGTISAPEEQVPAEGAQSNALTKGS
jgi:hypothetical protein